MLLGVPIQDVQSAAADAEFFFYYLLFNQTPVAKEQIMEFSGGEGACTQPT